MAAASWQLPDRSPTIFSRCTSSVVADAKHSWAIHREAPAFVEQSTAQEVLETGIKVSRLPLYSIRCRMAFKAYVYLVVYVCLLCDC